MWALKLFPSFVNTDGKHEHRLKLENVQPVFPNYNAIPTTITKIIMVSYPDEFDGHLVHNYTAAFRVWRVKILNNNFSQEPITRSEQLTCPRVTAFSRTSLFLERFCREF